MPGVQAGQKGGARRCADRAAGVGMRESKPLGGKPVEMQRGDLLLAIAAQMTVAEIIGHN